MKTTCLAWKPVVAAVVCAAVLSACTSPPPEPVLKDGDPAPAALIDPYVKIGDALSKDSTEGVSADASQLATAAKALGPQGAKVEAAAVALASATGISGTREKFVDVSDAVVGLVDEMHLKLPDGVRVAVCPMKRKPWMLKDAEIGTNPVLRSGHARLRRLPVTISFSKHTLENGMDVLLHEDRSLPIVAVNLWYHVGSKNEVPGRTGFAHLFEHLMFEGLQHHDKGYFKPLQGAGASLNGSTNADRTNYWELVPTEALELALWMESDRMGFLLPALTEAKFANQRDVVLNERRQNYENRPYGLASMAMLAALYPPEHPYHWTTIGEVADLHAARLDQVREFFATYYHPANVSLALAGDIDSEAALALVRAYFENIPAGPAVPRVSVATPSLNADSRLVLEDRVELPRLYVSWLSPAMFAGDDAELDLAADILANGKTSRLYKRLVFEERLATDVSAAQGSREIGGFLQVSATATPGHSLGELERVIREEIGRLSDEGPTPAEIERGRVQTEAQFMFRLQSVGGFGGKSDQLNAYNTFVGDPSYFSRDLARYQEVTPESMQSAVTRYLHKPSVMLSVVPRGRANLALPDSVPAVAS